MSNYLVRKFVCRKAYPGFPKGIEVSNENTGDEELYHPVNPTEIDLAANHSISKSVTLEILVTSSEFWSEVIPTRMFCTVQGHPLKLEIIDPFGVPDVLFRPTTSDGMVFNSDAKLYSKMLLAEIVNDMQTINGNLTESNYLTLFNATITRGNALAIKEACKEFLQYFIKWRSISEISKNNFEMRREIVEAEKGRMLDQELVPPKHA